MTDAEQPNAEEPNTERPKFKGLASPKKRRKLAARERRTRRTRSRRVLIRLAIFVGLPTLISAVYFAFIASDVYESSAVIMIQSAAGGSGGSKGGLASVARPGSSKDAAAVKEYIRSRDMLALLEEGHQVTAHYSQPEADWWSRLTMSPTFEETYTHYLRRVEVSFGGDAAVMTLNVKAYSAEKAQAIALAIIKLAEHKVNTLSSRLRDDQVAFAKSEVGRAETRLSEARTALEKLQGEQPATQAEHPGEGPPQASPELESALNEKAIAEKDLHAAMKAFAAANNAATRQSRYLVTIAAPSSPDAPTHPKRILGIVTVFFASLAIFGILSLLIAAVREHARV